MIYPSRLDQKQTEFGNSFDLKRSKVPGGIIP